MSRIILHIDMDAFFAAVEQLDHPEYKGKPVIVGADPQGGKGRGVVSTCSYEARRYGIHSAMPISQAYQRCPFAIYLPGRMRRYQEISRQVMKILYDFTPLMEQISIDEAFLDIGGCVNLLGSPKKIALDIKKRISEEIKLTASVGVAPSKFVAKIASDLQKPDGLVIVEPENVENFLRPLAIGRMWGVGKKTEPKLLRLGIRTIGDLADYPQEQIVRIFGKSGLHFWYLARGIDDRGIETQGQAKSVSQETTFMEDTDDDDKLRQTLFGLSTELSRIMRQENLKGKTITLKIRLEDFSTYTRAHTNTNFTNSSREIFASVNRLFDEFNKQQKKVRLVGIAVSNLNTSCGEQISFFQEEDLKQNRADQVIDLIQKKFGIHAIKKASLVDMPEHRLSDQKLKSSER